ncbi:ECF sigma factor [Xanthomonas fragariae LMG 25863]|nr:ECF sigma factor [Xanthomonas fragariae LMG 25863]
MVQAMLERALRRWRTRHTVEALQPWLFAVFYRHLLDAQRRAAGYGRPRCIAALTQPP